MNKKLHFRSKLIPLILFGKKNSTWRVGDDKNLTKGDIFYLLEAGTEKHFATAKITKVLEKQFKNLTTEDKKGHEQFKNEEEMYKKYSGYYQKQVTPETSVKIIWFKLINDPSKT